MQRKILVVDDDAMFLELISDVLRSRSYFVLTAENGTEALSVLESEDVDIIVSDVEMPTMNGLTLHEKISHDKRLRQIPFIFITGSEQEFVRQYFKEHPSVVWVRKTNMMEQLPIAIAQAQPQ